MTKDAPECPRATDDAFRTRMDTLMNEAAALLREYGLFRGEWRTEGVDPLGRTIRHRFTVDGYSKKASSSTGDSAQRSSTDVRCDAEHANALKPKP